MYACCCWLTLCFNRESNVLSEWLGLSMASSALRTFQLWRLGQSLKSCWKQRPQHSLSVYKTCGGGCCACLYRRVSSSAGVLRESKLSDVVKTDCKTLLAHFPHWSSNLQFLHPFPAASYIPSSSSQSLRLTNTLMSILDHTSCT